MTGTGTYPPPRLLSGTVLGPPLRSGTTVVHHVKAPHTGTYYRVGPREHFVMSRLDGAHTTADISREYAEQFHRALGQDSWAQIFTMLGSHRLLEGTGAPKATEGAAARTTRRNLFQASWPLVRPDAVCTRLARALAFVFRPAFLVVSGLLILGVLGYLFANLPAVGSALAAPGVNHLVSVPVSVVLGLVLVTAHELAHGVTCKHFGGEVPEIGIRWRLPIAFPYCRTDDVVLFERAGARVATAFAGSHVTLLLMVPTLAAWFATDGLPTAHAIAASLLLFGSIGSLVNLFPFAHLDGYLMLSHALGMADLRRDTGRFWRSRLSTDPQRRAVARAYPRRDAMIHTGYGLASVIILLAGYAALMWWWYTTMRGWIGAGASVAILAAETAVFAGLLVLGARAARRRRADG